MMNKEKEKKNETVEVVKMVEKTVIEITGRYLDPEGFWIPIIKRTTVLVPEKEA